MAKNTVNNRKTKQAAVHPAGHAASSVKASGSKASVKIPALITGIYLILMFFVYPLAVGDQYFDILQTKYTVILVLAGALALALMIRGLVSGSIKETFQKAKADHAGSDGRWFFRWIKASADQNDIAAAVYFLILTISLLQASPYIFQAFFGNEGRYCGYILMSVFLMIYLLLAHHTEYRKIYMAAFLAGLMVVCLFGITDFFRLDIMGWKESLRKSQKDIFTSTIGNVNTYTVYCAFLVAASGALFIEKDDGIWVQLILWVCFTTGCLALITGISDNAYLSLAAYFGLMPLYAWKKKRGLRRYCLELTTLLLSLLIVGGWERNYAGQVIELESMFHVLADSRITVIAFIVLLALTAGLYAMDHFSKTHKDALLPKYLRTVWLGLLILAGAAVLIAVIVCTKHPDMAEARFGALSKILVFNDEWGTSRGYIWRAAIEEYAKLPFMHKLFGTGPETFGIYMVNSRYYDMVASTSLLFDTAHNEFLQLLFTTGIFGLLAYAAFFGVLLARIFRSGLSQKKPVLVAAAFVIICYLAQSFVNITTPIAWVMIWVLAGMAGAILKEEKKAG